MKYLLAFIMLLGLTAAELVSTSGFWFRYEIKKELNAKTRAINEYFLNVTYNDITEFSDIYNKGE